MLSRPLLHVGDLTGELAWMANFRVHPHARQIACARSCVVAETQVDFAVLIRISLRHARGSPMVTATTLVLPSYTRRQNKLQRRKAFEGNIVRDCVLQGLQPCIALCTVQGWLVPFDNIGRIVFTVIFPYVIQRQSASLHTFRFDR
jgi:hypothetical protein